MGKKIYDDAIVGIDTETTGLNPYQGHRVFCYATCDTTGRKSYSRVEDFSNSKLKSLLYDPKELKVFHNAKFDLKMLSFSGIDLDKVQNFHCTLVLSKLFCSAGKHDLRTLCKEYLRRDVEKKNAVDTWLQSNRRKDTTLTYKDVPNELVRDRCVFDAECCLMLFLLLYPKIVGTKLQSVYKKELNIIKMCIDIEKTGVRIDTKAAQKYANECSTNIDFVSQWVQKKIAPITVPNEQRKIMVVNLNSTKYHLPAIFTKLGIALEHKTEPKLNKQTGKMSAGGNWSFDEHSITKYCDPKLFTLHKEDSGNTASKLQKIEGMYSGEVPIKHLFPFMLLEYRKNMKLRETYYSKLVDSEELHCTFNPSDPVTGRMSSSQPNFQNYPLVAGPRRCFVCRPGTRLWYFDYEQIEMRLCVHFSQDARLREAIEKDIHTTVACDIYHCSPNEIDKAKRKVAKTINFCILYGGGPSKVAFILAKEGIIVSEDDARYLVREYHNAYPSIRQLTNNLERQILQKGYVENPFGRKYYLPREQAYKAINYLIQGTAADLLKERMVRVWNWLRITGKKSKILKTVHDEIEVQIPYKEEIDVVSEIKSLMEDKTSYLVPIRVGVEFSKSNWAAKLPLSQHPKLGSLEALKS